MPNFMQKKSRPLQVVGLGTNRISTVRAKAARFSLEFDAARKIAQGLSAQLDTRGHVVEVKGDKARLLSVAERTKYLFGGSDNAPAGKKTSTKKPQRALFED